MGFAALVVLSVAMGGFGIYRLNTVRATADQLGNEDAELLVHTQGWLGVIEANTARTWVVFFAKDAVVIDRVKSEMKGVVTGGRSASIASTSCWWVYKPAAKSAASIAKPAANPRPSICGRGRPSYSPCTFA